MTKAPAFSPAFSEFENAYNAGQTQLLTHQFPGDLETPVGTYLKLCMDAPYSFLLESIEGGEVLGRYSIIGIDPDLIWSCKQGQVEIDGKAVSDNALESLRVHIQNCKIDVTPEGLPPMAVSGLFGYLGYDMIRLIEDIPDNNPDDLGIPDSVLMRPTALVIFDNVKQVITLAVPVYHHAKNHDASAKEAYERASAVIENTLERIFTYVDRDRLNTQSKIKTPLDVQSNMTQEEYHEAVKKAVDYTFEGDIFQVVPSQRFSADFDVPSYELYRSLRRVNPSPFMFHVALGDFQLVGASPEILVRVRDNEVTVRPIAGTRKRGANAQEDQALAEELLGDEKERAEHLMLLDLGRNDIGRVAEFGSVKVTESFIVEKYSHVMHIVSNVTGQLKKGLDILDALFAGFPAGTVSGAPKVRAMEIIDELESTRRGFYAGAVGYLSGNGTLDTCIALRTAMIKDGKIYVQAGGGVVADSEPKFEYQETVNKSRALIRAAELALENHK
ncbi:MAG: anthranilate synthase component I [Pseudomonadota bacterium]